MWLPIFFFLLRFAKKSPANRGIEHKDADLKSTDANQVYIEKKKKIVRDVELYTMCSMNNVRVSETKTLILMKPRGCFSI